MHHPNKTAFFLLAVVATVVMPTLATAGEKPLFDFDRLDLKTQVRLDDTSARIVTHEGAKALEITFGQKRKWPGLAILAPGGAMDLSAFSRVELTVFNPGSEKISVSCRVDNAGADGRKNCNTAAGIIKPGETKTITVRFGYSWGQKGADLDLTKVTQILIFGDRAQADRSIIVTSVKATGKAAAVPAATKAPDPLEFSAGFAKFDASFRLGQSGGGTGRLIDLDGGKALEISYEPAKWPGVIILPPMGTVWNFSKFSQLDFDIENPGKTAVHVGFRVDNKPDGKSCSVSSERLKPGQRKTVSVRFGYSWGRVGYPLDASRITQLLIYTSNPKEAGRFIIRSITPSGKAPAIPKTPKPKKLPATFSFEDEEGIVLTGGEITRAVGEVIEGKASLLGDSRGKRITHFEFVATDAGTLVPGYNYRITFKYRVLRASPGAVFYIFLRSKSQGWGRWDRGWTDYADLSEQVGKTKTASIDVGLDILPDYRIHFGIKGDTRVVKGDARVVVDEMTVTQGKPYKLETRESKLVKAIPPEAKVVLSLDFEQDAAGTVEMQRAKVVGAPRRLQGSKSLLLDSTSTGKQWNTFLSTLDKTLFKPGHRYYVTFRYKQLAPFAEGGYGNVYLRPNGEREKDIGWKKFRMMPGYVGWFYQSIDVREDRPYQLFLGIHRGGKVAIDELTIRELPIPPRKIDDRKPLVRTKDNLVFADEFDGKTINEKVWTRLGDYPRKGAWWIKSQAYLNGKGHLVLKFDKEANGRYVSGGLSSEGKYTFKYGYVEVRMKNPTQPGHWPGAWLFTQSVNKVGNDGRDGTEVDIVEAPWRKIDKISHGLHWDGYGPDHQVRSHTPIIKGINEGWHTYGVDWSEDGYIFFVDGKETWRTDAGGSSRVPLHLLLTDEMTPGGGWAGSPENSTWPDYTYFDYIRVWQAKAPGK